MKHPISRRTVLTAGAAGLVAVPAAAALPVTPRNELGPFYRRGAPSDANLRHSGDAGLPLDLGGKVLTTSGEPVAGAVIELWHADHSGRYDVDGDRFRAQLITGADGSYGVSTVMPGHYPDRVCQHIHFIVKAPKHTTLVTQLYFASDPVFDGDPQANFRRDPLIGDPALIRPVSLVESGSSLMAKCHFDLVLGTA